MPSTLERTLRITSLVSSVFAIAILLPATVESSKCSAFGCYSSDDSIIGFGFIPLSFTIITSLFYVAPQLRNKKEKVLATHYPLPWMTFDFAIFGGYMVALVFEWVEGKQRLSHRPDIAFLEAYATVPLMVNMIIHMLTFFINGKVVAHRVLQAGNWRMTSECPHCHHRIGGHTEDVVQKKGGEGYSLLRGEDYDDDVGRASEDHAAVEAVGEV